MMKKIIYMYAIIACLSSCTKHEEIVDTSFQVGNIYCSDGSIIHPTQLSSSGKIPVGVVFWCNDGSNPKITDIGYAVSLEDLSVDLLINTEEDIPNVSESEDTFDGAANTAAIVTFAMKDSLPYPAIQKTLQYAPNGVTGWFMPSAGQSKEIGKYLNKVYDTFDLIKGQRFSGWYWTSTEDGAGKDSPKMFGLVTSLEEGRITASNKNNQNKIRPIITIR